METFKDYVTFKVNKFKTFYIPFDKQIVLEKNLSGLPVDIGDRKGSLYIHEYFPIRFFNEPKNDSYILMNIFVSTNDCYRHRCFGMNKDVLTLIDSHDNLGLYITNEFEIKSELIGECLLHTV